MAEPPEKSEAVPEDEPCAKKKWGDDFSHEMRGIEPAKNGNLYDYYKIFLFLFNNIYIYIPMDPSTFLGSVWGIIWRVKYLLRQCLDP